MTRVRKGCRSRKCNKSLLNYLLSIRLIMKGLAEHFNDLMYRPIMITSMRTVFILYPGVFLDLIKKKTCRANESQEAYLPYSEN